MAGRKLTYSQTIFAVKIILPAVAILLIIGVFALSRGQTDQTDLPLSVREISERLREQAVANPLYIGSTQNGIEVRVSAERLVPAKGKQEVTTFSTVRAEFIDDQISIGIITATQARLDTLEDTVEFIGDVVMTDDEQRQVNAGKLLTNRDMTNSVFDGSVKLIDRNNLITSEKLEIFRQTSTAPRRFVFTDNVKLIYNPKQ
jgi:lipopolysaccharide assembly outer membrane protein LptD (OstA)